MKALLALGSTFLMAETQGLNENYGSPVSFVKKWQCYQVNTEHFGEGRWMKGEAGLVVTMMVMMMMMMMMMIIIILE